MRIPYKPPLTVISCCCLSAIAVFGLFSYPLNYPFVWVAGLLSCFVIIFQGNNLKFTLIQRNFLYVLILLLIPIICFKSFNMCMAELKWRKIARLSLKGQTEQMLPEYQLLHNKMSNNDLFLYNYAAELNFAGHYEKSLSIARECELILADYDLQMLMADNCQKLKNYEEAERHYHKATAMFPVKFMPLYKLVKIYDETGRRSEAVILAEKIINKPIKVPSSTIQNIQQDMMKLMENEENKYSFILE